MGLLLDTSFYAGAPQQVAKNLLGKLLVRELDDGSRLSGIVVEVEAYLSMGDPASHSYRGQTGRNHAMFLPAGSLYVYTIHARHCLNVVTEALGVGSAVLIRAAEPFEGESRMAQLRCVSQQSSTRLARLRSVSTGPGRLCQAFAVDRRLDGCDLTNSRQVYMEQPPECVTSRAWRVKRSQRIGVSRGKEMQLRWLMDGHQLVSGCAGDHSHGRTWRFRA